MDAAPRGRDQERGGARCSQGAAPKEHKYTPASKELTHIGLASEVKFNTVRGNANPTCGDKGSSSDPHYEADGAYYIRLPHLVFGYI